MNEQRRQWIRETMQTAVISKLTIDEAWDFVADDSAAADPHSECVVGQHARAVLAMLDELKSYRAREALVQEVFAEIASSEEDECISALKVDVPKDGYPRQWMRLAVQEYLAQQPVLQPSLDHATKTGDKPGADSDHTQEPADKSDTCHLSSVVEQRFRKPSDSQELPQASETTPGNAGNDAEDVEQALRNAPALPNASPTDYPWFEYVTLAAEVRRLRAIVGNLEPALWASNAQLESAREVCDPLALRASDGYLHEYIQRLRSEIELKSTTSAQIATENVRLREENARLRRIESVHSCGGGPTPCGGCCACMEAQYPEPHEYQRMQAKLARVEALVPKWRHGTDSNGKTHAAELESALRDGPPPMCPVCNHRHSDACPFV